MSTSDLFFAAYSSVIGTILIPVADFVGFLAACILY